MPQNGAYVVTRHDLVMQAVRNTAPFSNRIPNHETSTHGGSESVAVLYAEARYRRRNQLLGTDPPEHSCYRSLVDRFFTAKSCRALRPKIEAVAAGLVAELAARGQAEIIKDFALKLPVFIIADMLGAPRADVGPFQEWSAASLPTGMDVTLEQELANTKTVIEFYRYMECMVLERRENPRDDILSSLAAGRSSDGAYLEMP